MACRRSAAEREAQLLLSDVRALIAGSEPFDCLSIADRVEQLEALGVSPARYIPRMSDADLIELVAALNDSRIVGPACDELANRLDSSPDSITRAKIERPTDYASIDLIELAGHHSIG